MKTFYLAKFRRGRTGCEGSLENFTKGEVYFTDKSDAVDAVKIEQRVQFGNIDLLPEPVEIKIYESLEEYQSDVDAWLKQQIGRAHV